MAAAAARIRIDDNETGGAATAPPPLLVGYGDDDRGTRAAAPPLLLLLYVYGDRRGDASSSSRWTQQQQHDGGCCPYTATARKREQQQQRPLLLLVLVVTVWQQQHDGGCCSYMATARKREQQQQRPPLLLVLVVTVWQQQHDGGCCSGSSRTSAAAARRSSVSSSTATDEVGGATARQLLFKYGDGGEEGAAPARRGGSNASNMAPPAVAPLWRRQRGGSGGDSEVGAAAAAIRRQGRGQAAAGEATTMSSKVIHLNPPIPAPREPQPPRTMSASQNTSPRIISCIVDSCLTAAPPQIGTSSKAILVNPPIPALPERLQRRAAPKLQSRTPFPALLTHVYYCPPPAMTPQSVPAPPAHCGRYYLIHHTAGTTNAVNGITMDYGGRVRLETVYGNRLVRALSPSTQHARNAFMAQFAYLAARPHLYAERVAAYDKVHSTSPFAPAKGPPFTFAPCALNDSASRNFTLDDLYHCYAYGRQYLDHVFHNLGKTDEATAIDEDRMDRLKRYGIPPTIPDWTGWFVPSYDDARRLKYLYHTNPTAYDLDDPYWVTYGGDYLPSFTPRTWGSSEAPANTPDVDINMAAPTATADDITGGDNTNPTPRSAATDDSHTPQASATLKSNEDEEMDAEGEQELEKSKNEATVSSN
ncbi:hypothetical protein BDZ97DRAFT_1760682 [Flammula alnicola]|nr:hypothetical protein BDZ97DRAFT_1760682 [Flammula alnicola]